MPIVVLYQIECQTPNHFYVGISSHIEDRLHRHSSGKGAVFTRLHGVKHSTLICTYEDVQAAKMAEWELVKILRSKGHITCGAGSSRARKG